jgi:hypothetical protein
MGKIIAFQYLLLAQMNPLKYNKSKLSRLSILNSKLIKNFQEKYNN